MRRNDAASAFVSYLAVTAVLAFPLVRSLSVRFPSDPADPVLNAWILWWNTQALPLTQEWWHAPAFYPTPNIMAYSEHLVGLIPIYTPFYWITGSPVVAYNLTFLLTFPLSGWAAYLLGRELTGRRDAAWLAGLAFAFAPYRMDQLAHLQVLASFWMPLALLGLHRYVRVQSWKGLLLFVVATAMQGLSNGYFLAFLPVLVALWAFWFSPTRHWWKRVGTIGIAGGLATLPSLPFLLQYQSVHASLGLHRTAMEVESYSADLTGLLSGAPHLWLWGSFDWFRQPEGQLFPGIAVVVLIVLALCQSSWRSSQVVSGTLRVIRIVSMSIAFTTTVGLGYYLVAGPWQVSMFGMTLALTSVAQWFPVTLLAGTLSFLVSPVGVEAYRRRSPLAFYLFAGFVLTLLAMGPYPSVSGTTIMNYSPYLGLMQLPGFDGLRVPARFWMLVLVCLSAAVAIAYARVVRSDGHARGVICGIAAVFILLDGWAVIPIVPAPVQSEILNDRAVGPVLELPLGWRDDDVAAMLRSATHHQPVVNGHSGYAAPHYGALAYGLGHSREELLRELGARGVRHIRIDRANPEAPHYESLVASSGLLRLVAETGTEALYEYRDRPDVVPFMVFEGESISLSAVTANTNNHLVHFATDRDSSTRWFSGAQDMGQQLVLDLGAPRPLGGLVMRLGRYRSDFPRLLGIELSTDGQSWELVRGGPTDVEALRASFQDPETMPLVFDLEGETARYLRLRQMASEQEFYWSVAEVEVIATAF
tara:strand:+ start:567 stop:2843 length:2277 start_codon:yes stop_codon:yes gene_type:complete